MPKEYLHSAELRDIMQFGSSSQAVFFKMRVAGVLHIFQFETKQGEDICMALQTHINDIMMKRYSKSSKPMSAAPGGAQAASSGAPGTNAAAGGAGTSAYGGGKYEAHVQQVQKLLEEANKRIETMQKAEDALRYAKDSLAAEMEDLQEQLRREQVRAAKQSTFHTCQAG